MTADGGIERDVVITAPDGVELVADVYRPAGPGPHATLLQRTCYGKDVLGPFLGLEHFTEAGYRVVLADCRGSGSSGGEPDFFAEAVDGRATGDWIARQPWFDGRLGTFGGSYMGFTQWAFASTRPPYLGAMAVGLFGADRRAAWYPGGTFALDIALPWTQVRALGLVDAMRPEAVDALARAFDHLPLADADTVAVGHPASWYQEWLAHPEPGDPYWAPLDFTPALDLGVPVLLIDGWYDYQLPHVWRDMGILRAHGAPVRLVAGPWTHTSVDETSAEETLRWFDVHLRGAPPPADRGAARVFVMPDGGWRELDAWPPEHRPTEWFLRAGGGLAPEPATGVPTTFAYDPADPTPAAGGASLRAEHAGPVDNRALEARADVCTFTSAPLDSPIEVLGPVHADLHLTSDVEHFDLFVRLCDVWPDGRSINVCDGIRRFRPVDLVPADDGTVAVRVSMSPTAMRFGVGHRIRLQVSGGAHPLYARNPCSGEPLGTATTLVVAHHAVHHDAAHPSRVVLPTGP